MEKANAGDRRSFLHRLGQELMQHKRQTPSKCVFPTTDYRKIESAGQQIHTNKQERHRRLYIGVLLAHILSEVSKP
uniref:Uncharacterized protein n=1 Tax=Ditylenchus dipsaci TaxID=166011 RepID=A0A915D5F7_9BILA